MFLFQFEAPIDDNNNEGNAPALEQMIPGSYSKSPIQPPQIEIPHIDMYELRKYVVPAIVALFIVIGVLIFFNSGNKPATTTTSMITTTVPVRVHQITACGTIGQPGQYYLNQGLHVNSNSGPCLNITSSDVELIGNQNFITGTGPYSSLPPFSYAISAYGLHNITIDGFVINNFSYGIYAAESTGIVINNNNVSKEIMSGILFINVTNSKVTDNTLDMTASNNGAINIFSGSNVTVANNKLSGNDYYGLVLNSTNNTIQSNKFSNNVADLYCSGFATNKTANRFLENTCQTNFYCNGAYCSNKNIPSNFSQVTLSQAISTCGSITTPGNYYLARNIDVSTIVNASNPLAKSQACITIASPDVHLACGGYSIRNAGYGIYANNTYNTTIQTCNFYNNSYGLYLKNMLFENITGVTANNNTYGFYLSGLGTGTINDVDGANNTYGIYMDTGTGITLNGYNFSNNEYGIYINNSQSSAFANGKLLSNTKQDFFCSTPAYNLTNNLFQNTQCQTTDCLWAAECKQFTPPSLKSYPINSCTTISHAGNYSLTANVLASINCISITANNVKLDCNGHLMVGNLQGTAVSISNKDNVTLNNCAISRFSTGVKVADSSYVTLENVSVSLTKTPFAINGLLYGKILNSQASGYSYGAGFSLSNLNDTILSNNTASKGNVNATGFSFSNSRNNLVVFNSASSNPFYGFSFSNSLHNIVSNNTASTNQESDYYCAPDSSSLVAESGGINGGTSKTNCHWLAVINPVSQDTCMSISIPTHVLLKNDMAYTYGQTCFNVYDLNATKGDTSVIDCAGHTVIATNGGTFASSGNATNIKLQNCYLKNFDTGYLITNKSSTMDNTQIANAGTGVLIQNSDYATITDSNFLNSSYGILSNDARFAKITNNNFENTTVGIQLSGAQSFTISNNNAVNAGIGIYFVNSTNDNVQNNKLSGSVAGISCTNSTATFSSTQNIDLGNNVCNINDNCQWMSSSASCRAS